MSNVIATYFYQEPENFKSNYANIFNTGKNDTYWNTIFLFFLTSTHINKNIRHCFFTNTSTFPYRNELENLGVNIYDNIQNTNLKEGKWASVKYFFDIVNYINNNPSFPFDSYYALFDTDCIAINPFDFKSLTKNNYAYISGIEKNPNYNFHGIKLKFLNQYYLDIFKKDEIDITEKIGGEFYCFKKSESNSISHIFNEILCSKYNIEIRTEEQILSMVNADIKFSTEPTHIKRVWTTAKKFNLRKSDFSNYNFLHLPAEKNYMTNVLISNYILDGYLHNDYYKKTLLYKPFLLRLQKIKKRIFK